MPLFTVPVRFAARPQYWHELMNHEIIVTLDVGRRMTIEWNEVVDVRTSQIVLRAGCCHVSQYPSVYKPEDESELQDHPQGEDKQIEELEMIFTQLIIQHFEQVEKVRQPVSIRRPLGCRLALPPCRC